MSGSNTTTISNTIVNLICTFVFFWLSGTPEAWKDCSNFPSDNTD